MKRGIEGHFCLLETPRKALLFWGRVSTSLSFHYSALHPEGTPNE